MKLVGIDEGKDTLEKYGKLGRKFKDLIRSRTNNSDGYDEKYMKIKFKFRQWFNSK